MDLPYDIGDRVYECVSGSEQHATRTRLERFMEKHSKLCPGVKAMRNMHDSQYVVELSAELSQKSCVGRFVYVVQLLTAASCSVVKYLSAEYQDETLYGNLLIGLYVVKMVLWGLGAYVESHFGRRALDLVHSLHGDGGIGLSTMASCICDMDREEVASIANTVRKLIAGGTIDVADDEQYRFERLCALASGMEHDTSIGKYTSYIARVLSILTGISAGVVTSYTDAEEAAFWMKISSNAVDAMTDHAGTVRAGEVVNEYVAISEIVYLCEYFLSPRCTIPYCDGFA
jgi:hypothetical protein